MNKTNEKAFTIYPAIDLRRGKVVRLAQGDPARQTVYSESPSAAAESWLAAGATWLHVVNLDGAFGEASQDNVAALRDILAVLSPRRPVCRLQLGGGLRNLAAVEAALTLGADRVILGTAAALEPSLVSQALDRFGPERIAAGIDVRAGQVAVRGWQETTRLRAKDLTRTLANSGLRTIVHTNISRDGMRSGADLASAADLSQATGLEVITAGGVRSLAELQSARTLGLAGAVIGRALYEGRLDLRTALQAVA